MVVVALAVVVATLTIRLAVMVLSLAMVMVLLAMILVLSLAMVMVSLAIVMVLPLAMCMVPIVLRSAETTPADDERLWGNGVWKRLSERPSDGHHQGRTGSDSSPPMELDGRAEVATPSSKGVSEARPTDRAEPQRGPNGLVNQCRAARGDPDGDVVEKRGPVLGDHEPTSICAECSVVDDEELACAGSR